MPDSPPTTRPLTPRARAALLAGRVAAEASKAARLGSGSVIGGRLSLAIDHNLLSELAGDRPIALVSATNGKTTTTHLLATALGQDGPVATNALGANMPPGLVAGLAEADPDAACAVLEVDERWLPAVLDGVGPATVVLLNLSRDQLDRSHEVRKIADTWRATLLSKPTNAVVANADDPLVVWAAGGGLDDATAGGEAGAAAKDTPRIVWVGTAAHWTNDASGCPRCGGRIRFQISPGRVSSPARLADGTVAGSGDSWRCSVCGLAKPTPSWWLAYAADGTPAVARADGPPIPLELALPGRVNAANAVMVVAAATVMGADPERAARAVGTVTEVAGRYRQARIAGATVRMLLAKNPAGWQEAIDMLGPAPRPVVASINARIADGRDPSWLWDVPFERLRGRFVVALGERRHDLAVRLRYAEVDHAVAGSLNEGVARAATHARADGAVDLIANYTAFQDYLVEAGPAR
jgi:lipid II isoglutaminyl synthase (glutamine-hydrolysing)